MYIARQLKEKNIAGYLLYMWQVEDLLRANGLDMEKVKQTLIAHYQSGGVQEAELTRWYEELIDMMRMEGVTEKGHLQINKNVVLLLTDLHLQLLRSPKVPFYGAAYYKALPYIVELRAKGSDKEQPELETCFEALYGVTLLRMQQKEVSVGTQKAVQEIGTFISLLSSYYIKDKQGELDDILNEA